MFLKHNEMFEIKGISEHRDILKIIIYLYNGDRLVDSKEITEVKQSAFRQFAIYTESLNGKLDATGIMFVAEPQDFDCAEIKLQSSRPIRDLNLQYGCLIPSNQENYKRLYQDKIILLWEYDRNGFEVIVQSDKPTADVSRNEPDAREIKAMAEADLTILEYFPDSDEVNALREELNPIANGSLQIPYGALLEKEAQISEIVKRVSDDSIKYRQSILDYNNKESGHYYGGNKF